MIEVIETEDQSSVSEFLVSPKLINATSYAKLLTTYKPSSVNIYTPYVLVSLYSLYYNTSSMYIIHTTIIDVGRSISPFDR